MFCLPLAMVSTLPGGLSLIYPHSYGGMLRLMGANISLRGKEGPRWEMGAGGEEGGKGGGEEEWRSRILTNEC